jgi:ribonuclease-3
MVNAETLAAIAEDIGLTELIHAGSEIRRLDGSKRVNIRADAMEALIAALYLEGGIEAARAFILRHWAGRLDAASATRRDPKTELQEWAHIAAGAVPAYVIDAREGPDHDPLFTVTVRVGAFKPAIGTGRTKRQAEQAAATAILVREGVWTVETPQ